MLIPADPTTPTSSTRTCRVFKDPKTIWQGLFKKVRLQEACFKDVVVLYRKAHPGPAPSELDIINDEETVSRACGLDGLV